MKTKDRLGESSANCLVCAARSEIPLLSPSPARRCAASINVRLRKRRKLDSLRYLFRSLLSLNCSSSRGGKEPGFLSKNDFRQQGNYTNCFQTLSNYTADNSISFAARMVSTVIDDIVCSL